MYVNFRDAFPTAQQTWIQSTKKIALYSNSHIKHAIILPVLSMAQQPPVVQSIRVIETSRSHSDTTHSVGLLWTSDQPVAEAST
jgi:hypothetical protein